VSFSKVDVLAPGLGLRADAFSLNAAIMACARGAAMDIRWGNGGFFTRKGGIPTMIGIGDI